MVRIRRQVLAASVVVGTAAVLMAATPSFAQASEQAVLRVPFRFVAAGVVLPSGTYTVRADSSDPAMMWITSVNGRHAAVVDTIFGNSGENDGPTALFQFKRYGRSHLLAQIAMPGEDAREIPLSRAEVEQDLAKLAMLRYEAHHGSRG